MNKTIVGIIACAFMLLGVGNSYAGLSARGGGESRTITSISPATVFNTTRATVTLSGRFSKKQGRNRRVVISQNRLPTPIPVRVHEWKRGRIRVEIPAAIQPGRYHIFLERVYRNQWRAISNKKAFEIKAARTMGQIRGRYQTFICNTPPQKLLISGGPFKSGGRHPQALNIHVEIQAPINTSSLPPTLHVISDTEIIALVPPCLSTHRGTKLRLVYPNGTKSNWIPIEQTGTR